MGKLRVGRFKCSLSSREFSPEEYDAGLELISQTVHGSKVIAFSNVGLQKFKMAAGGQNGGLFRHRLADRFMLSRGIFVPKGIFVALVVSSQYISLHPDVRP
jgi:hypothetical protein